MVQISSNTPAETLLDSLLRGYTTTENSLIIEDRNDFCGLTVASQNTEYPVQRWYNCKEAFSLELFESLLKNLNIQVGQDARILDTYSGTGTTLLSAQHAAKQGVKLSECIAVEVNPFFHFVTMTKANWNLYNVTKLRTISEKVLQASVNNKLQIPELTTLRDSRVFKPEIIKKILGYDEKIREFSGEIEANVLRLCLANTIEKLSSVRKDGRALRIVTKANQLDVKTTLRETFNKAIEDIQLASKQYFPIKNSVLRGDGRTLKGEAFSKSSIGPVDFIQCSPPYLNNIDYTEVYKLELWTLKFITNYQQFKDLRKLTFRSHPSIKFDDNKENTTTVDDINNIQLLLASIPQDKNRLQRERLFKQYFYDVHISLTNQYSLLKDNGFVFWIVGNSLHGSNKVGEDGNKTMIPIATDLLTAQIAQEIGFHVERIIVTRKLRRRNHNSKTNHFLRESIIILKKQ